MKRFHHLKPLNGNPEGTTKMVENGERSDWAAIQKLADTGLIPLNTRATRQLSGPAAQEKPALTPEQLQKIAELKVFAAKKQKVTELLIASDLADEAGEHQKAADEALAEASAIANQ